MVAAMTELILGFEKSRAIAWRRGTAISHAEFLGDVLETAQHLPNSEFALNLCGDRYNFLVAFAAAVTRGQVSLFPNSTAPGTLAQIMAQYPGAFALYDHCVPGLGTPTVCVSCSGGRQFVVGRLPTVSPERPVIHAFTSGSTGAPQATIKTWGALVAGASALERRVDLAQARDRAIVATVPPGHSYGMETTIVPPLMSGCATDCGQPLFPADVKAALERMPRPRCLVTTPVHLKALISSSVTFPAVDVLMCATAPLSMELARRAESRLGVRILEIYGCTESGWIATRRTTDGGNWVTRDDMLLARTGNGHAVVAEFLPAPVPLADIIETVDDRIFTLVGRSADMINIAGKRASLSGMTHILTEIDGVEDGVVFLPDNDDPEVTGRLIAVVVAPGLSREEVRQAFRQRVDPVFVPRHIIMVDALPRNETGKLPLERVRELVSRASGGRE